MATVGAAMCEVLHTCLKNYQILEEPVGIERRQVGLWLTGLASSRLQLGISKG
jgi:hypothetical protein